MISVVKLGSIKSMPATIITARSNLLSRVSKNPCRPLERATTPIEEVIIALRVIIKETFSTVPKSRIGLPKRRMGE